MIRSLLCIACILAGASFRPAASLAQTLEVLYLERPPYYYADANGNAGGILNDLTARILAEAGMKASFVPMPAPRILESMKSPAAPRCSPGWFKTPQRAAEARFSLPIYRNRPFVVLIQAAAAWRIKGLSFGALLRRRDLTMGSVAGYSFGQDVDEMLEAAGTRIQRVFGTQAQLASLINASRIDYTLVSPEEVLALLEEAGLAAQDFAALSLADTPQSPLRHLMCSQGVAPEVMARIDAAIARIVPDLKDHAP